MGSLGSPHLSTRNGLGMPYLGKRSYVGMGNFSYQEESKENLEGSFPKPFLGNMEGKEIELFLKMRVSLLVG